MTRIVTRYLEAKTLTSPLPPADDVQPEQATIAAPLNGGDWTGPSQRAPSALAPGKWTSSETFLGLLSVVLLVSLFLPWFNVTAKIGTKTLTGSISGTGAHGYLWVVFVLVLMVLLGLVAPELVTRAPARLPSHRQLIVGATALSFLLVLLAFLAKPPGTSSPSGFAGLQLQISATTDWTYGAWIALIAAILAFLTALTTTGALAQPSGTRARPA